MVAKQGGMEKPKDAQPIEGNKPVTGFTEAPRGVHETFGTPAGIGANRTVAH